MKISIIVVTYNAIDVTLQMYPTLRNSLDHLTKNRTDSEWEVINVDNGSSDGVAEQVEERFGEWVKVVKSENNGFSKGNNLGIENADSTSDYVVFINPDVKLEEDTLLVMSNYLDEAQDVGLATCRVDLWSGGLDWDCHRGFPEPWPAFCYFTGLEKIFGKKYPSTFGKYHVLDKNIDTTHEVDVCLGAFMIVRTSIGKSINWWPEDYMLNGEDVDFCYQIKELNHHKIMYVPETSIIHYKGASKGTKKESANISKASDATKKLQINSGIGAMEIFYRKYYVQKYPWILNQIVFFGIWLLYKKRLILGSE